MRPGSEREPAATSHECKTVTELRDKATWIPADGGLTRLLARRAKLGCVREEMELERFNLSRGHGKVLAKVSVGVMDCMD